MYDDVKSYFKDRLGSPQSFCYTQHGLKPILVRQDESKHGETRIEVKNCDVFSAAKYLLELKDTPKVCVLNAASDFVPGGGYRKGAKALEKSMFRRSTYALHLDPFYFPKADRWYPMKPIQTIFSPNVCVFRDPNDAVLDYKDCFFVDCVAVSALRRPKLDAQHRMSKQDIALTKDKIRHLFRVLIMHKHTHLVLCALGCGVFRNNPSQIAAAFHEVLQEEEFEHAFAHIVFAVLSKKDTNYEIFLSEFQK